MCGKSLSYTFSHIFGINTHIFNPTRLVYSKAVGHYFADNKTHYLPFNNGSQINIDIVFSPDKLC